MPFSQLGINRCLYCRASLDTPDNMFCSYGCACDWRAEHVAERRALPERLPEELQAVLAALHRGEAVDSADELWLQLYLWLWPDAPRGGGSADVREPRRPPPSHMPDASVARRLLED